MDDGPASHTSTNPSESVSFDEYIPDAEPAPYDLKDAFPGGDSVCIKVMHDAALARHDTDEFGLKQKNRIRRWILLN